MSPPPWAAHFGLSRTPFGKSIAARDLFGRQAHAEAIARISFCIVESALGVVMGDVGAGKTVALRATVDALDPTRHQVIYIANPAFGTRGLYVSVVRALGGRPRYLKAELMAQASDLLAAEAAERHRRVTVILDEAHLAAPDQLEELRLMLNAEMDSASPFAAFFWGRGWEVLLRAGARVWPMYVTQGTDGGLAAHGELLSSGILLVRPGQGG